MNIPQSWEGRHLQPSNDKELHEAIGCAFDYRGDVTIQLKTGEQVMGFVFDRQDEVPRPYIKLFLPEAPEPRMVAYQEIDGIVFSGEDTAFGRSWEDWAKKWKKPESSS
ncbi:MAG TPA: hypothetical protein PKK23_04295 [Nitrospirales bacterium]|nr:hypothetical protein [Nitrospiraceae bacterium]HNP28239.1 hypothetical protein [Nitrospirales bacterium]